MSKNWTQNLSYEERGKLAELVKPLRDAGGLSKKLIATEAKVSRQTLDNIESGATVPQADVLLRVLDAVGYETQRTLFDDETETWLTMIGTLIETLPVEHRTPAVDRVLRSLARDIRESSRSGEVIHATFGVAATKQTSTKKVAKKKSRDRGETPDPA